MADTTQSKQQTGVKGIIRRIFNGAPLLAILLGFLACTLWEMMIGEVLASALLLPKMPILFGLVTMFKVIAGMINLVLKDTPFAFFTLLHIPMALLYFVLVYALPFAIVVRLTARPANADCPLFAAACR